MNRYVLALLPLTLAMSSLAAAAIPATPAPDNSVPIGAYTLVSLVENGEPVALGNLGVTAPRPNLSFDGRQVGGFSGCNNFAGSYLARAKLLRFGALAVTQRLCTDEADQLEARYLRLLRGVNRFDLSGAPGNQTLTLFSGSADRLVLMQKVGSGEVASLGIRSPLDGTWRLIRPPAALTLSADTRPTQFSLRGSDISGFDGCNQFRGKANLSGGRLVFAGPVMATRVFCAPTQASLIPLFTAGTSASVKGKTLTLTGADGGQWMFEQQ